MLVSVCRISQLLSSALCCPVYFPLLFRVAVFLTDFFSFYSIGSSHPYIVYAGREGNEAILFVSLPPLLVLSRLLL